VPASGVESGARRVLRDGFEPTRSIKQKRIDLTESEITALRDLCRIEKRQGVSPYNQALMTGLARRGFVESQGMRNKLPVYALTELGRRTLVILDTQMNGRRVVEPLKRRRRQAGFFQRVGDWFARMF